MSEQSPSSWRVPVAVLAPCFAVTIIVALVFGGRKPPSDDAPDQREQQVAERERKPAPKPERQKTEPANTTESPRPTDKEKEPPVAVGAVDLWMAYYENAIAADEKYGGKLLKVTGTISEIGPDRIGFEVVASEPLSEEQIARLPAKERKWFREGYPANVVCSVSQAHKSGFAKATKEREFAIIGRCKGQVRDDNVWRGKIVVLEDSRADLK